MWGARNNGGAVLPVGETRRSADFHVSADLTRTSERRLQAEKKLRFEELRSRFPYEFQTFWSPVSREAERTGRQAPLSPPSEAPLPPPLPPLPPSLPPLSQSKHL